MKKLFSTSIIAGLLACGCSNVTVSGWNARGWNVPDQTVPDEKASKQPSEPQVLYHNAQYNFTFSLPTSWQGYSVLTQQWVGQTYFPATDKVVETEHGPSIVLRHPQWKADDPRQDIPIDVFTRRQWKANHEGLFAVCPDGFESEIAHNGKYVFAIWNHFNRDESVKGARETVGIIWRNQAAHGPHLYPE